MTIDRESNAEATALMAKNAKKKRKQQQQKSKSVMCFVCEKGHYTKNFPKKTNKEKLFLYSSFVAQTSGANDWYVISGASAHMTMQQANLIDMRASANEKIIVGDNIHLDVKCADDVKMTIAANDKASKQSVITKDVLYIPNICTNLMSVSQVAKHGNTLIFDKECCKIFDEKKNLIATASLVNDLYKLSCSTEQTASTLIAADKNVWHCRLGHVSDANLDKVKSMVNGIDFKNGIKKKCVICVQGKQTRSSFGTGENHAKGLLDLIHSDIAFMLKSSFGGTRYFVTFVDDYSHKLFLYPTK